jgi:N-acetylmuramoyl-L-alanine amidase
MKGIALKWCPGTLSLPDPKGCRYLPATMRHARVARPPVIQSRAKDLLLGMAALVVVGCRAAPGGTAPEPVLVPDHAVPRGVLPPVPLVQGPLAPTVVYPRADATIQSRDSNFVLGSVGNGRASLFIDGAPVQVWPNGAFIAWVANPTPEAPYYQLVAAAGSDTARLQHHVKTAAMIPPVPDSLKPPPAVVVDTTPTWVVLGLPDSLYTVPDTDRVIIGRPGPNSVYRWFLMPGTRVQLTGRYPGFARIRLDSALQIWVDAADAKTFAMDTATPRRVTGNARVRPGRDSAGALFSDVIIPVGEKPAYFIEERERSIDLTLYDTRGGTDLVNYSPTQDSLVKTVEWEQVASDRVRYTIHLSSEPFGYLTLYENGAFVLRVRRPPQARREEGGGRSSLRAPRSSLEGLTIAVDPGHPPAGATGPTGFYEADAVLPVGFALKKILEERGARVVMTRTTRDAVDLALRNVIARRAGAHAFVSLHYNAYGDGINPLRQRNGMEVYFYRTHSEPLARAVQSRMLAYLPLEDQGVYYRSLAVVRTPWMPAILVEGGFIIMPEQESAFRTEWYQERYARAVADGLESYFRGVRNP